MSDAGERLRNLQKRINERRDRSLPDRFADRLYLSGENSPLHVDFWGLPFEEAFYDLLRVLAEPMVAASLCTLSFRGPDEGANGTRNWDFSELIAADVRFPNLQSLFIEPSAPEDHNRTIVAAVYEEEGQLGRLLEKMPELQSLTAPSAPNESFFQVGTRPLRELRIEAGYDHQNFLSNLARSSCFPVLQVLDYADVEEEDNPVGKMPFSDYEAVFTSAACRNLRHVVLRNPGLTEDKLSYLRRLRSDIQLQVIRWNASYIR